MDCRLPGFSVHEIFQARILEWVAISFSRRSSRPRDWTLVSRIVSRRFTIWAPRKRPWCWENWRQEEKRTTEDEMVGWHHRLNGHEFEWTPGVGDGQGGLACCTPWGRKESDMTEQVNWTELDGPRDYHTEWSKSDRERQISHAITYMWNQKMV